ncbi:MAG: GTP pyrophosphokinase [Deltaproteobacteria bacterium]|jgi:(p)ppGpp synthase/HD superfamily hydrolase|nr:GTP pyrophosphokinase [Deltaproteobacteria bacterium]|tara:strand:+ start:223 stop:651 length:429 start_codon:yes stop_codon:yes gene_type:complete
MNLERAIEIAVNAHKGVTDKGGNPYIVHPLRVMMSLKSDNEKIVGVLHDVVEDAEDWDFERLQEEGFSKEVLDALRSVTKTSEEEDYNEFVQRALTNEIGRAVKIADIRDNLDVTRIGELRQKDMNRLNKYKNALKVLLGQD